MILIVQTVKYSVTTVPLLPNHMVTILQSLYLKKRFDGIVLDLQLSKEQAQRLGSHLKSNNLLTSGTTFYWYRVRERNLSTFFLMLLIISCAIATR